MIDGFQAAFSRPHEWIRGCTKQRQADGTYSKAIKFWSQVTGRARDLLQREPKPGIDYAITEIVRCHSWKEHGVAEALDECTGRWLDKTLNLSPSTVIIVLGKNAASAIRDRCGLGDGPFVGPAMT